MEWPVGYLIGCLSGLGAVAAVTFLLGVPSSFTVFAVRTAGVMFGASLLGVWGASRYAATDA